MHRAFLVLVQELHRVFDRDDVSRSRLVDLIEQGSNRGRLPLAGIADNQHQAAIQLGEVLCALAQADPIQRHRLGREAANHASETLVPLERETIRPDARTVEILGAVESAVSYALLPVRLDHLKKLFQLFARNRRV